MSTSYLILDVATAPIADAAQFIDDSDITAPSNYGEEAAKKFVEKGRASKVSKAGLDVDLCRISGIGLRHSNWDQPATYLCKTEGEEKVALGDVARMVEAGCMLIGYNCVKFDFPVLMRRARYLGVSFPEINIDRFKTRHLDLFSKLTNYGALSGKSLRFYVSRIGWLDLEKPLQGDDEARVFETGAWDLLKKSIEHDVEATHRLAKWLGVIG